MSFQLNLELGYVFNLKLRSPCWVPNPPWIMLLYLNNKFMCSNSLEASSNWTISEVNKFQVRVPEKDKDWWHYFDFSDKGHLVNLNNNGKTCSYHSSTLISQYNVWLLISSKVAMLGSHPILSFVRAPKRQNFFHLCLQEVPRTISRVLFFGGAH